MHERRLGIIAKAHVLEGDGAGGSVDLHGVGHIGFLFGSVQKLEGTTRRGQGALEGVHHIGRLGKGLGCHVDVLEEGLGHTHRHDAGEHEATAGHGDDRQRDALDGTHDRVHGVHGKVGLLGGFAVGVCQLAHRLAASLLLVAGADDVAAGVVLLHLAGKGAQRLLTLAGSREGAFGDEPADDAGECHKGQVDQGKACRVVKHDGQHAHDGAHCGDELEQAGLHGFGDLVQVAGDTGEDLAGLMAVEEAQG